MAGGNWVQQNKVRAGAYVNVASNGLAKKTNDNQGVIALPLELGFAPENEIVKVSKDSNLVQLLGYNIDSKELKLVKEAFKRVNTLLVYRVNADGEKATTEVSSGINATAVYSGTRGNDIAISVKANLKKVEQFDVITYLANEIVDIQTVGKLEELQDNAFVEFTGDGVLQGVAGVNLIGGTDGTADVKNYTTMLEKLSTEEFDVLAVPVTDSSIKEACVNFAKRMRIEEGKRVQVVVSDLSADDEAVISVVNGVVLNDGSIIEPHEATVWVAAASAGAGVKTSNTFTTYEGATDVTKRYTNTQIIELLEKGSYVFTTLRGRVVVEQDINTLVSFTAEKNEYFAKNRVLRTLDNIANNTKREFEDNFIGKVQNNQDGRELFKVNRINYFNGLQTIGAIEEFTADDITVEPGDKKDSIVVNLAIKPVDAMEKLYMTVVVQ